MNEYVKSFWERRLQAAYECLKIKHDAPFRCKIKFILRKRVRCDGLIAWDNATCELLICRCADKECRFYYERTEGKKIQIKGFDHRVNAANGMEDAK